MVFVARNYCYLPGDSRHFPTVQAARMRCQRSFSVDQGGYVFALIADRSYNSIGPIPINILLLIEWLKKMCRRVLTYFAADSGTDLGTVAKVHTSPHTSVTFLCMNLIDT